MHQKYHDTQTFAGYSYHNFNSMPRNLLSWDSNFFTAFETCSFFKIKCRLYSSLFHCHPATYILFLTVPCQAPHPDESTL